MRLLAKSHPRLMKKYLMTKKPLKKLKDLTNEERLQKSFSPIRDPDMEDLIAKYGEISTEEGQGSLSTVWDDSSSEEGEFFGAQ